MTDELRLTGVGTPRGYSMGTQAETFAVGFKAEATVKGLRIGAEGFRRNWNASTMMAKMSYAPQASIPDVNSDMLGVFLARDWNLGPDLLLHAGARVDQHANRRRPRPGQHQPLFRLPVHPLRPRARIPCLRPPSA